VIAPFSSILAAAAAAAAPRSIRIRRQSQSSSSKTQQGSHLKAGKVPIDRSKAWLGKTEANAWQEQGRGGGTRPAAPDSEAWLPAEEKANKLISESRKAKAGREKGSNSR